MDPSLPSTTNPNRIRALPVLGIGLAILVLAGTIAYGTMELRHKTRSQILQHPADLLHKVAQREWERSAGEEALGGKIDEVTDQLLIILKVSDLKGVIAARLIDTQGRFVLGFPAGVREADLDPALLPRLRQLEPVGQYVVPPSLDAIFTPPHQPGLRTASPVPLLIVTIPLHKGGQGPLVGLAQFVIDGVDIQAQFKRLDRNLAWQAGLVMAVASLVLGIGLALAFRRLTRTHQLLIERTRHLESANRELALAARTSALGAVTAHLVHGLSSPLSGLKESVDNLTSTREDEQWEDVVATTRRMQSLVEDAVRVISEAQDDSPYEVTLDELRRQLEEKLAPVGRTTGVTLRWELPCDCSLSNRQANLVRLILENLLHNALQATPAGGEVTTRLHRESHDWCFEVEDQGRGIPPEQEDRLFQPGPSPKSGGSGIGLAISRQLAIHLGGTLELTRNDASGCRFTLRLPASQPHAPPRSQVVASGAP